MIKCVIWDIDNTLLAGVFLESGPRPPPPDETMLGVLRELGSRGIVHALASRNPPEAAEYVEAVTGMTFAAVECGWGPKSDAIRRVAGGLDLAADAVAFVDDDLLERAEVAYALPEVLVLSPEDACDAVGWPEFSPAVVTAEGRRRGEMYAQRQRRLAEARAFGGSRDEFLRYCGTAVVIEAATDDDVPRLHELSVRTHQFNSAGAQIGAASLAALIGSAEHLVIVVRLADRFGDDGIVGGCVIRTGQPAWSVRLLMMSCRAMGRGVIDALLAWLCRAAAGAGAPAVRVPCLITPRNVPLRLALAGAGFRAGEAAAASPGTPAPGRAAPDTAAAGTDAPDTAAPESAAPDGLDATSDSRAAIFARQLSGPLPPLPGWVTAPERR
jgi:methoxymalonate biosynthesis protein